MIYNSFAEFMEKIVIPQKEANPDHKRLDGREKDGNREIAGIFRYNNKMWKVHADTRYEPLLIAYDALQENKKDDLFNEASTNTGKGRNLLLVDKLQQKLSNPRFKHLYIYEYLKK